MSKKEIQDNTNSGLNLRVLVYEMQKMFRIFLRSPNKGIVIVILIFPITFTLFMGLVFGRSYYSFPTAIVVEGYATQAQLDADLNNGNLPETERFINYINNYSLVDGTIVHSEVVKIVYSLDEVEKEFKNLEILVILILPENFEKYINQAKNGQELSGNMIIECKCANINEDLLKNLYFGIERKIKAYYDLEFPGEIEVDYTYSPADPNKKTFPRMWTISSGGIVFSVLVAALIIGSAMVFIEKHSHMDVELLMISPQNRGLNYSGKVFSTAIISTLINFPFASLVIFLMVKMELPVNIPGLVGMIFLSNIFGACLGIIFGVLIKEQVFTFPVNVFILLPAIFLCGGFMDVELFGKPLLTIVNLIPFTYIFTLVKYTILPGFIWNWEYFIGLIIYIIIFFILGWKVYENGMVKGWNK
ncbi:MAG: ABC transporter permease [Promethearchaeota archaeon]